MPNFEVLNNLVDEFNRLCNTVEEENREIERQIEEKKEEKYFWLCTDLAPYFAFYRENGLCDMTLYLCDYDGPNWNSEPKEIVVCFHARSCYLCFRTKGTNLLSMENITRHGDFKPYKTGYMNIVDYVADNWSANSDHFEKDFYKEVHDQLTARAKRLNEERSRLEENLRSV